MKQQRKIIRYMGAVIKITPSIYPGDEKGYMEWMALLPALPGRMRQRIYDPTNCGYSIPWMKNWLRYGKDAVHDHFVYENRRKAHLVSNWQSPSRRTNRLTQNERLDFKRHIHQKHKLRTEKAVRGGKGGAHIAFGEPYITKYPPEVCALPWFRKERSIWMAEMNARYEAIDQSQLKEWVPPPDDHESQNSGEAEPQGEASGSRGAVAD